jgi:hypothetical protein
MGRIHSVLQKKIIKYLKSEGWYAFAIQDKYRNGTLDIYAAKKTITLFDQSFPFPGTELEHGVSLWIEVKVGADTLSDIQKQEIHNLRKQNILVFVAKSVSDVKHFVKEFNKMLIEKEIEEE